MTDHQTIHPAAQMYARECQAGVLSRREFLTRATALGVSAAAAYGLLGLPAPAAAQDAMTPTPGGTLRLNMETRAMRDPRTWDWSEYANFGRGWLDYMVEYQNDGSLRPMLLESWEASADATQWTLKVRPGVKWNNGDDFTAEDVAHNIRRWADGTVEGNSMAARFDPLRDLEGTNQARPDAIEVVDPMTVRLRLSTHEPIGLSWEDWQHQIERRLRLVQSYAVDGLRPSHDSVLCLAADVVALLVDVAKAEEFDVALGEERAA